MPQRPKLVAVVGPTGSGKTALGASLCQRFGGEIVSADSKQVYIGLDIGTAKEKDLRVPQHLVDICQPGERFTAGRYQELAYQVIDGLLEQGKLPVLVGGTGLYVEAVVQGYAFGGRGSRDRSPRYDALLLGIDLDREELKRRVAARTRAWLEQGLLEEIRGLLERGVSPAWLATAGQPYKFFTAHLLGELSLEEALAQTDTALNQYVRRQYTWWRHHSAVVWVKDVAAAEREAERFLAGG